MNEFFKTITLEFETDGQNLSSIKSSLDALTKNKLFDEKSAEKLKASLTEFEQKEKAIAKLQKDIAELQKLNIEGSDEVIKKLTDELHEQGGLTLDEIDVGEKDKKFDTRKKSWQAMLLGAASKFLHSLKKTLSSALDRLQEMTKYSFMTDSSIRDMKLSYGLSSSQAYGMSQALEVMGIGSIEDLMWADSQQLELFKKAFDKYTQYYEDTMSPEYIAKQLEYQTEMKMFKMDVEHEIIGFLMDNKETIMKFMEFGMEFMEAMLTLVGGIFDAFSDEARTENQRNRETQSILSSYTSNNNSRTVSQNNTFNIAQNDTSKMANFANTVYKQTIEALDRG